MKIVKRVIGTLIVIAIVLAAVGMLLPSQIRVERSIVIQTQPEVVFAKVNNLSAWDHWSPWYETEPNAKYSYTGPESGEGATSEWEGEVIGTGKQVITESIPNSSIKTKLDFGPQGTATADWTFAESDGGTKVTWGFDSDLGLNPIGRYMGSMIKQMVAADYEKGLSKLKTLCESEGSAAETADEAATEESG